MSKIKHGEVRNPNGRPKNSGHRQQLFNSLVEPYTDALFNAAIQLALSGNEAMLRLFLERMLPAKPLDDAVTMEMPEGTNRSETLAACGANVLKTVSHGDVTPREGASLMVCLEAQRKIIETSELSQRMAEIERTLKQRPWPRRKQS